MLDKGGKMKSAHTPITDGLRALATQCHIPNFNKEKFYNDLIECADNIDREHQLRMKQCNTETKKSVLHYIRSVANDYEKGIKRVRKE